MPWFFHLLNSDNDSIYFTGLCKINKLAHLISALLTVPITAHMQKILPIMIPTLKCHTHNQGSFCCRSVWWPGMIPIHTRDSFYKHCFLKQVSMSYLREFPNCWIFFFFFTSLNFSSPCTDSQTRRMYSMGGGGKGHEWTSPQWTLAISRMSLFWRLKEVNA